MTYVEWFLQTTNDLSCALCKTVMELVDQAITDGANEQAVCVCQKN